MGFPLSPPPFYALELFLFFSSHSSSSLSPRPTTPTSLEGQTNAAAKVGGRKGGSRRRLRSGGGGEEWKSECFSRQAGEESGNFEQISHFPVPPWAGRPL